MRRPADYFEHIHYVQKTFEVRTGQKLKVGHSGPTNLLPVHLGTTSKLHQQLSKLSKAQG